MNEKLYRLMNWPGIEAIIYSEEDDPHRLLGPHREGNATVVQAFYPGAVSMELKLPGQKTVEMEQADEAGYYAALVGGKEIGSYTLKASLEDGTTEEFEDPYRFAPVITKEDTARFAAGIHYEAYRILGAHMMTIDKTQGVHFAVWAPNALRVSVVGDFNHWDGRRHQMRRLWDSGIFEIFIPGVREGENYKFELKLKGGLTYLKADPYAFGQQLRPDTASVVRNIDGFAWEDEAWILAREKSCPEKEPMSVYEMYLGSFAKPEDGRRYYNYREFAPKVISYVKEMGYTHVELMPVMEHPLDGSWGYQVIGYYAPTARYGTPQDFMYFVNELHKAGIGVILDWVPAHFPRDAYGLSGFDGTCLYEHKDPRQGAHPHWGTLIYNYGRPQVSNYLIANALYWVEQFHADGIRMDAVASMLYLDYGKQDGEWIANMYGGNENLEAVEFLKHTNSMIQKRGRGAVTIAEESTAWPKVTGDLNDGGLGFTMKWNMGWMNDFLDYMQYDPYFRAYHHNDLTFSMVYAYSEKFMLVLSHDEVVHGKASMLSKMPGEEADKFANLRAGYGYMMTHPGKKLLFMGQDIAEYDEWNEERGVEWELLKYDYHEQIRRFVKRLNELYRKNPALYAEDNSWDGFEWIDCIDANECTLSYLRKSDKEEETLLVCLNFANVDRPEYRVGVPFEGKYTEVLNSDDIAFGGKGRINSYVLEAEEIASDGRENSILMHQAPLSVSIFAYTPYTDEEKEERRKIAEAAQNAAEEAVRKAAEEAAKKEAIAKKAAEEAAKKEEAARKAAEEAAEKEAVARQAAEEVVRKTAAAKKAVEEAAKKAAAMKKKTLKEELTEKAEQADSAILEGKEKEKPARRTTRKKTATAKAVAPKEPTARKPASVAKKSTSSAKVTKGTKA